MDVLSPLTPQGMRLEVNVHVLGPIGDWETVLKFEVTKKILTKDTIPKQMKMPTRDRSVGRSILTVREKGAQLVLDFSFLDVLKTVQNRSRLILN